MGSVPLPYGCASRVMTPLEDDHINPLAVSEATHSHKNRGSVGRIRDLADDFIEK